MLLQDLLKKAKERLDNAIEVLALLCEPVESPKGELEHIHYFCANTEIAADLKDREPQRAGLYKATVTLVRAYANIADELEHAGYSATDIGRIKKQLDHYLNVREIVRMASGETLEHKLALTAQSTYEQAQAAAQALVERWNLGERPADILWGAVGKASGLGGFARLVE